MRDNKPSLKLPIVVTAALSVCMVATASGLPTIDADLNNKSVPAQENVQFDESTLPSNRMPMLSAKKQEIEVDMVDFH